MRRLLVLGLLVGGFGLGGSEFANAAGKGVQVVADEAHQRVDITIDGKAFTSYIWPTSLKKPVLYPLITDEGITVTRGYPLEPRPGERVDHPHHAGMWFNYGNVNGFDFWNNSDAIKPEGRIEDGDDLSEEDRLDQERSRPGRACCRVAVGDGRRQGNSEGHDALRLHADERMPASSIRSLRSKALDKAVFNDDKEGVAWHAGRALA